MPIALDGLLNAEEEAQLNAHIATCERCRAMWEAMNAVSAMLAQAPMSIPPPDFTSRVMARLKEEAAFKARLRLGSVLLFSAAYLEGLLTLLTGIALGVVVWFFPAKGLLLKLALRWLWRLGGILGNLLEVGGAMLHALLPPATAVAAISCGLWMMVLFLLFRRYGYARSGLR